VTAGPGRRRQRRFVGDSREAEAVVEGLVAPGEGGEGEGVEGSRCGHPLILPFSASPGRGPSREVVSPGGPEPTRATESWR